jgi:hypothetical protein
MVDYLQKWSSVALAVMCIIKIKNLNKKEKRLMTKVSQINKMKNLSYTPSDL